MGNGEGTAAAMEGVHASVAGVDALFLEDAALATTAAAGGGVDVLQRAYELRLDRLGLLSKLEAQVAALKARDVAEAIELQQAMTPPEASVQDRTYAEMSAIEEIAGVLTISGPAAGAFINQSRQLCSLPLAMEALSSGTILWQHAKIIADETDSLGPAGANSLAAHFLAPDAPNAARGAAAGELVPSRFRARARSWRERHHPESIEKRHAKGVVDRRMEYSPDRDGMAWFSAFLPGDTALAMWNDITATARGLQGPDESRTLTQLRPDILCNRVLSTGSMPANGDVPRIGGAGQPCTSNRDHAPDEDEGIGLASLVGSDEPATRFSPLDSTGRHVSPEIHAAENASTDGNSSTNEATGTDGTRPDAGKVPTPRADVLVTVPVFSLLGLTDEAATLDGHGPIPASMARKLVADGAASFYRVLVDPRDGAPLEIGRTSYRLTKAMKQALRLRDGKCTFPGCNNRSPDNETDHLQAWQHGGPTGISNLAQLCPKHHRLKHNSRWASTPATQNEPPGWTSPTGRHYKSERHDWEPPLWPAQLKPLASHPDFVYTGLSPGEDGIQRFLHRTGT